jgi:uncharacterized coiled-coil DUF342 family protein
VEAESQMTAIIDEAGLEERDRQRAATECAELRAELADLRAALANLRGELDQRRRADFQAIEQAVANYSNDVLDQVKTLTKQIGAELFDKLDSSFAALQARVDAVLPDTKSAFRVARERADEASELPDPLPPRRAIN